MKTLFENRYYRYYDIPQKFKEDGFISIIENVYTNKWYIRHASDTFDERVMQEIIKEEDKLIIRVLLNV